jgi:hypothetical protein
MPNLSEKHKELIKEAYKSANNRNDLIANIDRLMECSDFKGIKRNRIKEAARSLGISRYPIVRWTDEEDAFIEERIGSLSIYQIHRSMKKAGWKRSVGAIADRINYLGYSVNKDVYRLKHVYDALGVPKNRVNKWIAEGKLKATRAEPCYKHELKTEPAWEVRPCDLAQFIREHPEELYDARPDVPWLISLLKEFWRK